MRSSAPPCPSWTTVTGTSRGGAHRARRHPGHEPGGRVRDRIRRRAEGSRGITVPDGRRAPAEARGEWPTATLALIAGPAVQNPQVDPLWARGPFHGFAITPDFTLALGVSAMRVARLPWLHRARTRNIPCESQDWDFCRHRALRGTGMLSSVEIVVGLFPGQGAYLPGALARLRAHDPETAKVIETIDTVADGILGKGLSRAFSDDSADQLVEAAPDVLQLAVFATSVAAFRALSDQGARFSVLVGHSLGEIAALVAGGALGVAEGAEILCHRITVLREHDTSGGGLLALGCAHDRAQQILDLLPTSGAVIAVDNGPAQTVVAGRADALRRTATIATAIGLPSTTLHSPHPFHSPLLAPARQELARRLSGYGRRGLRIPVFSPVLGRYYRDSDDLGELLASHLVTPVRFGPAVERLHRAGAGVWVEVGAGRALTSRVRSIESSASVHTPLLADLDTLRETGQFLAPAAEPRTVRHTGTTMADPPAPAAVTPEPSAPPASLPPQDTSTPPVRTLPPTPPAETPPGPTSREAVAVRVRDLYATTLEYPEEVFEDGAELEADLGVDSVKRVELMGRLGVLFELGPPPDDLRMADYRTFGQVVDFVVDSLTRAGTT
ncbi:acyltransferase domain-containing protein [Nonomuraea sp. JJY05]|uniref:acyltransferase domain-containing protein n=1 Tax=Nonomuraea sp. JJY05 TaxID=3350255 RepID=UPI00373F6422